MDAQLTRSTLVQAMRDAMDQAERRLHDEEPMFYIVTRAQYRRFKRAGLDVSNLTICG